MSAPMGEAAADSSFSSSMPMEMNAAATAAEANGGSSGSAVAAAVSSSQQHQQPQRPNRKRPRVDDEGSAAHDTPEHEEVEAAAASAAAAVAGAGESAETLSAFMQLLAGDPSACASLLQHARLTAPHLLPPHLRQTLPIMTMATASSSSFQPTPAAAESEAVRLSRITRLRDQALVPGVIALVLAFLPVRERPKLGRISCSWAVALQQPSAWSGAGWSCEDLDGLCAERSSFNHCFVCTLALPIWLQRSMHRLRCGAEWLCLPSSLAAVSAFTSVQHLHIHASSRRWIRSAALSSAAVRRALQPLRLLSLELEGVHSPSEQQLLEAIFGQTEDDATASSSPLRAAAPSPSYPPPPLIVQWALTLTRLDVSYISLLHPEQVLGSLAVLHWPRLRSLTLSFGDGDATPSPADLQRCLAQERMPQLQALQIHLESPNQSVRTSLTAALLAAFPQLGGLTELDVDFSLGLTAEQSAEFAPGPDLLPSLRKLHCDIDARLQSSALIAATLAHSPSLELLHLRSHDGAVPMCEQLALRMDDGASLGLRELHLPVEGIGRISQDALHDLTDLPQLEALTCCMDSPDVYRLSALQRLRLLTLACEWDDETAHDLGSLGLPHLHTLTMHAAAVHMFRRMPGSGPGPRVERLSVEGGLRQLLLLPSLTCLQLPDTADEDAVSHMRLLARAQGRDDLVITREADPSPSGQPPAVGLFEEGE